MRRCTIEKTKTFQVARSQLTKCLIILCGSLGFCLFQQNKQKEKSSYTHRDSTRANGNHSCLYSKIDTGRMRNEHLSVFDPFSILIRIYQNRTNDENDSDASVLCGGHTIQPFYYYYYFLFYLLNSG